MSDDATAEEVLWKDVRPGDLVKMGHLFGRGLWFSVRTIGGIENKVWLNVDGLWTDVIQQHANDYVTRVPAQAEWTA